MPCRDLLRVMLVVHSHTVSDLTLTLLSVETYADGSVTSLRVRARPAPSGHRFPWLALEVPTSRAITTRAGPAVGWAIVSGGA